VCVCVYLAPHILKCDMRESERKKERGRERERERRREEKRERERDRCSSLSLSLSLSHTLCLFTHMRSCHLHGRSLLCEGGHRRSITSSYVHVTSSYVHVTFTAAHYFVKEVIEGIRGRAGHRILKSQKIRCDLQSRYTRTLPAQNDRILKNSQKSENDV
jgi:hypothetical protein